MKISDIVRHKGESVVTVSPEARVRDVLALLAEHNIGALVVTSGSDDRPVGIISERDIVRALHEVGDEALEAHVEDVMSGEVVHCAPGDPVESVAAVMTEQRVRH
ncbi:MAG: CBS domain-containing protein, partial [Actinobacteria bacterium]|nr:CBS domain-containing protein [Actinomycetota bacterium]